MKEARLSAIASGAGGLKFRDVLWPGLEATEGRMLRDWAVNMLRSRRNCGLGRYIWRILTCRLWGTRS